MAIKVYTLEQSTEWDEIVRSFVDYDIYWLSGYVKAFYLHGDGEPFLFVYKDKMGTRGILVAMKRDIADDEYFNGKIERGKYFDLSSPYGYGGWLIEGENTEQLFIDFERWCCANGIVSEFVRFHPMLQNQIKSEKHYRVIELGEVVHIDLSSPEIILENFTSKNRNVIRKAMKNGVKIYNGRYPEIYKHFKSIYDTTMNKDKADEYYYFEPEFYESILWDLPHNAQVFYAEKDGVIIAASIMLTVNRKMNYHLSGSIQKYSSFAPTNLLLYEAALWGNANGYKTLYLGGGVGSGEDTLFKFKRSFFKGNLNHFHIGKKIYDRGSYIKLCDLRGITPNIDHLEESGFFPEYRG